MKTLELKHLAPYLPYEVKMQEYYEDSQFTLKSSNIDYCLEKKCRIYLRPPSDLTKVIEHNGEMFVPNQRLDEWFGQTLNVNESYHLVSPITHEPYVLIRQLFEWHFDVFRLIDKGLAIDINTLNQ